MTDRPNTDTLAISGALDAAAVEQLRPRLERHAAERTGDLELDLSGVDFLDSSGVGAIVFLFKRLVAQQRRLLIVGAEGQPRELIRFLRIDRTIPVNSHSEVASTATAAAN